MNSLAWKHFARAVGCVIKTVEVPCALGSAHLQFLWLLLLMMASVGQCKLDSAIFHNLILSVELASRLQIDVAQLLCTFDCRFTMMRFFVAVSTQPWSSNPNGHVLLAPSRDVRWSKLVGTGKERNAFPFKKGLSLSPFFLFSSFLERVFPLFPIFLGISHPILRRSFPVFSSFHLSKPVPGFLMALKLAILERVLNENLSKPVLCHS